MEQGSTARTLLKVVGTKSGSVVQGTYLDVMSDHITHSGNKVSVGRAHKSSVAKMRQGLLD